MKLLAAMSGALLFGALAQPAHSAIVLDGLQDADYGSTPSYVAYDASAPLGNFDNPGPANHAVGYSIYLTAQSGYVYGLLRADPTPVTGLNFANLYFDLDPANGNGSDLGFEVTNLRAFVAGVSGYAPVAIQYAQSADLLGLEFAIPNALFTSAIAGLNYSAGLEFPNVGDSIVLRMSQAFGYSVAGGASYGDDRLGAVTLEAAATPLPAALPLFMTGLGALGLLGWRRKRTAAAA